MKTQPQKSGFTLVELMVVAVIVAILAAVAVPLMSSNKQRAMATEAQAALGTVRSALRAMYAETGDYTLDLNGDAITTGSVTNIPGIRSGDLTGRFFGQGSYSISNITQNSYVLVASGSADSLSDPAVSNIVVTLDQDGNFSIAGL